MDFRIERVDYTNETHAAHLIQLLNEYACDPMGGGKPIPSELNEKLIVGLRDFPTSFSLLVYRGEVPAALSNCFFGFSTFAAQKLINIHDLMVSKDFRGNGLSTLLLQEVEKIGRENECVKITLEVLSNNEVAKNSYKKFGFEGYELDPEGGQAIFWQKKLI